MTREEVLDIIAESPLSIMLTEEDKEKIVLMILGDEHEDYKIRPSRDTKTGTKKWLG
ncbi:MAG: hypothetical protein AB1488_03825 [Nitrospirota bacterium]